MLLSIRHYFFPDFLMPCCPIFKGPLPLFALAWASFKTFASVAGLSSFGYSSGADMWHSSDVHTVLPFFGIRQVEFIPLFLLLLWFLVVNGVCAWKWLPGVSEIV